MAWCLKLPTGRCFLFDSAPTINRHPKQGNCTIGNFLPPPPPPPPPPSPSPPKASNVLMIAIDGERGRTAAAARAAAERLPPALLQRIDMAPSTSC